MEEPLTGENHEQIKPNATAESLREHAAALLHLADLVTHDPKRNSREAELVIEALEKSVARRCNPSELPQHFRDLLDNAKREILACSTADGRAKAESDVLKRLTATWPSIPDTAWHDALRSWRVGGWRERRRGRPPAGERSPNQVVYGLLVFGGLTNATSADNMAAAERAAKKRSAR